MRYRVRRLSVTGSIKREVVVSKDLLWITIGRFLEKFIDKYDEIHIDLSREEYMSVSGSSLKGDGHIELISINPVPNDHD